MTKLLNNEIFVSEQLGTPIPQRLQVHSQLWQSINMKVQ